MRSRPSTSSDSVSRFAACSSSSTWAAPWARASAQCAVPTGPAPITATVWSSPTLRSLWPQIASDSGSANVEWVAPRPSGTRKRFFIAMAGIATSSA